MPASTTNLLDIPSSRAPEESTPQVEHPISLRGSLDVVSAIDLLEWLCSNRKTWTLRLLADDIEGRVVVAEGQLVDAHWGSRRGVEALSEIVAHHHGHFDLVPVSGSAQQTLHGHWRSLLLSAAQLADELRHKSACEPHSTPGDAPSAPRLAQHAAPALVVLPSIGAVAATGPTAGHARVARANDEPERVASPLVQELIDDGFAALRGGDKAAASRCWTKALALDPDHRGLLFNLRLLESSARAPVVEDATIHTPRSTPKG